VYVNDMYVPAELSLPTAQAIRGLKAWVTDEYEHDGLRASSAPCSTACSSWPAARPDGTEGIPKVTGAGPLGVAVAPRRADRRSI
jgi:hypothetical protein